MHFSENIKSFFNEYKKSFHESRLTFVTSILMAFFSILDICWNGTDFSHKILKSLHIGFLISTLASYSIILLTKKLTDSKRKVAQFFSTFLILTLSFLLYFIPEKDFAVMYVWGIALSIIFLTLFIFSKNEYSATYANILKYFCFTELLCGIVLLGMILLTYAFCSLMIGIDDNSRIYEIIFSLSLETLPFNVFCYFIFNKINRNTSGNGIKIVFVYILVPIFSFLILLLYAYLIKSAFTKTIPNGQINYFVSFATGFFLIIYFVLKEHKKNRFISLFYRYSKYVLIPLVFIQMIAFYIRLKNYGLTEFRYASLLYIIFSIFAICVSIIKNGKYMQYIPTIFAGFIVFATLSHFNLINVAWKNQHNRLNSILSKYDLLKNEEMNVPQINVAPNLKNFISKEDSIVLYDSWFYLKKKSHKKAPAYILGKDFSETFNMEIPDKSEHPASYYAFDTLDEELDIAGYDSIRLITEHIKPYANDIILNEKYNMTEYLIHLTENPEKYAENIPPFIPNSDVKIIFRSIHFDFQKNTKMFTYVNVDGFELTKQAKKN